MIQHCPLPLSHTPLSPHFKPADGGGEIAEPPEGMEWKERREGSISPPPNPRWWCGALGWGQLVWEREGGSGTPFREREREREGERERGRGGIPPPTSTLTNMPNALCFFEDIGALLRSVQLL